jgi:hypothetical protein
MDKKNNVKTKIKKKVAIGNVKKNNKKQKQKQKQTQNTRVNQSQRVVINVPETKPKRKYTRRKAPTVQPIQLPQQPQQFEPNAQAQLNDLKQQMREREKVLQKEIDEKLKREERNTEQEIIQRLGIRNKSEMNNANDFFGRLNEPQPPPETATATAINPSDWLKKEQLKREEAHKEIAKLKASKAGKEASLIAKEKERQRKAQQTREANAKAKEQSIINDIQKYKNKSPEELKKLETFKNVKHIKTATDTKQILTQYIHQRYGTALDKAKDYTSKH